MSIQILLGHWQHQLEQTRRARAKETIKACAEIQDDLIAKYQKWIKEGERQLGMSK